jgi:enamine deaminase RidA (YjgF/YER057c/UK114 family)
MKKVANAVVAAIAILLAGCANESASVRYINASALAKPVGFSHVAEVSGGRTLYVSGITARDPSGKIVGPSDLKAQTRQVFENLKTILAASGATLDDVVKVTTFVTDLKDLKSFREVRDSYFPNRQLPASTFAQVVSLVQPEIMIEMEAIVVVNSKR